MARVVVLGGTGHVGGYLVPRLVAAGHEVTVVTRGKSRPYRPMGAVETVVADRGGRRSAHGCATWSPTS
jgi:uncharacterized protein YbjT (DUF2867 family)